MDNDEKLAKELKKLYDSWDEDCLDEGLESLPLYSNLRPEPCRYSSEEIIAEGGMKKISKMFDPKVGRNVAMASLHADAPKELYEPFLREAYLTSQLDHPNIITIFDILLDEDLRPRFTMELKTGQTFKDLIIKAHQDHFPFSTELNQLLDIFLKICDAMTYAHDKGVVHLDLKPENIQVGTHGEVIVCDWGIGKALGKKNAEDHDFDSLLLNPDLINTMTMQGKIKGTPGYMAPEQVEEKEKNQQTDIYALGAILYTIITGKIPVEGKTLDDLLKNTIDGNIIKPEDIVSSKSPGALGSIATKALSLKPEDRFESVSQMQQDVRRFLTGYSPSTETFGFFKEVKLLYFRNKVVSNICLIFIVVLSLAISLSVDLLEISESKTIKAKKNLQEEVALKVKIGKNAAPAHTTKALEFLSTGQYDLALKHAETAVKLNENSKNHNLQALVYFIHGRFRESYKSFWEPTDLISTSLKKLCSLYMKKGYDLSEEDKHVKELLTVCTLVTADERTTTLFLYWLKHENKKYQQYAIEWLNIPLEHVEYVLKFAANLTDSKLKEALVNKVMNYLYYHRQWPQRRKAVELAISLTINEKMKKLMTSILPPNLILGQEVIVTGKSISNPESAVDGDNRSSSCWSTSSPMGSIEVDMGRVEEISKVYILFKQDRKKTFLYRHIIEISTDGKKFTKLIDQSKTNERSARVRYTFKATPARFIRLSVESKFGVHIVEFSVLKDKVK